MVGCHERAPRARQFDIPNLHRGALVVDMIQMQERKNTRIRSASLQVRKEIDAVQGLGQHLRRQSTGPLVEVAQHHFGAVDSAIPHDLRELNRLVPALEQRRTEVHIVEMHGVIVHGQINPLAAARFSTPPRQVILGMLSDGQAAQDDVAEEMPPQTSRWCHDPAHTKRGTELLGMSWTVGVGSDHFLERDDVGIDVREHGGRSRWFDTPVEAPTTVDIVGRDAHINMAGFWDVVTIGVSPRARVSDAHVRQPSIRAFPPSDIGLEPPNALNVSTGRRRMHKRLARIVLGVMEPHIRCRIFGTA
jgi:hypothetical protein